MDDRNYDQDLQDLIQYWDPIIKKVRESRTDNTSFLFMFALSVFSSLKRLVQLFNGLPGVILLVSGALAVIGNYLEWPLILAIARFLQSEKMALLYPYFGTAMTILYIVVRIMKMSNHDSEYFHHLAYKLVKPQEYKALLPFMDGDKKFSFEQYAKWLQSTKESRDIEAYKKIAELQDELSRQEQEYLEVITTIGEEQKKIIASKNERIERLADHSEKLLEIINHVKMNIERYLNGQISVSDLGFLAPYTLYEKQGNYLVKIADVGTSGHGKKVIDIEQNPGLTCVQALEYPNDILEDELDAKRLIYSYKMDLADDVTWVINFHIDKTDQKTKQIFSRDPSDAIMDLQIVLDLVRTHCHLAHIHRSGHAIDDVESD